MTLIQRKARPLKRDETSLRDDRLFIVASDDTYAPKQYFGFFQIPRVQVHIVPTGGGTSAARHVLERLLQFDHEEDDELWLLLDTDHYTSGAHFPGFISAVTEARRRGVKVALSRPCFELWLLLHHVNEAEAVPLADASAATALLRSIVGQYNKSRLRAEHYPVATVPSACERAERLDSGVGGGDNPDANTSRVYLLWKSIVAKALPSQLPEPLRGLLP
jgi:hypothetical protein